MTLDVNVTQPVGQVKEIIITDIKSAHAQSLTEHNRRPLYTNALWLLVSFPTSSVDRMQIRVTGEAATVVAPYILHRSIGESPIINK
jgi:hypothetical protein